MTMDDSMTPDTDAAAAAAASSFDFRLYRYTPSLPAAIIFVVTFAFLSSLHTWRIQRHRAFYFTAFTVGGFFETVGYCGRIWSHFDTLSIGGFVIQAILILVAPALFAASIYMILGRLIRTSRAQDLSLIPIAWLTKVFVIGDVVSFSLQAGGGGIQAAGTLELFQIGEKIIITGLFVQIIMFSFFMVTAVLFQYRLSCSTAVGHIHKGVNTRQHLNVLYTVSALILIRSIFRVIEYLQGNGGYLISHEAFLYVFDAVLMTAVMVIFLVWYIDDIEMRPFSEELELSLGSAS